MIPSVFQHNETSISEIEIRISENLTKCKSAIDLNCYVNELFLELKLDGIILLKTPKIGSNTSIGELLFSSSTAYSALGAFADFASWSILKPLRHSYVPYTFHIDERKQSGGFLSDENSPGSDSVDPFEVDFLTQIRAKCGCCVPFLSANGTRALAIFVWAIKNIDFDVGKLILSAIKITEFIEVTALTSKKLKQNILNAREIECLRWVAAGKTSSEIAKITSLSEHTINHYLQVCCKKLDTVNRIQAAVTASRLELI
jgi:DNA-binding CsgD family transcriptional regulator